MSNSIISFGNRFFRQNDSILFITLSLINESISGKELPEWFKIYKSNIIDNILKTQPVGYSELWLSENFGTEDKRVYFINLINECILNLKKSNIQVVEIEYVNEVLDFDRKNSYSNPIEIDVIYKCLNNLMYVLSL